MVDTSVLALDHAWDVLNTIPDPDIPVISIVELGLVRDVRLEGDQLTVDLTPSYSGCPAMYFFKEEVPRKLKEAGFDNVQLRIVLSPPWTTDWLSDEAKLKMKKHGIAPPEGKAMNETILPKKAIACPWCSSKNTLIKSQFGSTPCKALWFCDDCHQPFEYFKCY